MAEKRHQVKMKSIGRVQVVLGREIVMRCKKCGGEQWRVLGEVRREEKDNPLEVKCHAMRMACCRCDAWIYLDQVTEPQTPTYTPKRYYMRSKGNGIG